MLAGSKPLAVEGFSSSPLFEVSRGKFEADAVAPATPSDAGIISSEPDAAPSSSPDGNASSDLARENRPVWGRTFMDDAPGVAPSSSDRIAASDLASERERKPVWGRTINGGNDVAPVVMGGSVSWPALSKSTKTSSKTSPERLPSAQGHVNSSPTKRKFAKPAGGGNGGDGVGTSGSFSSNASSSSSAEKSERNTKHPAKGNYSYRDGGRRESHGSSDQKRAGDNSRRGYHGNKRDQDRGVHQWNSSQGWSGRYFHRRQPVMQPPMPAVAPFIGALPFQHFPGPMTFFPDFTSQGYYFPTYPQPPTFGRSPFVPPTVNSQLQRPMFFGSIHQHRIALLKQIEYYFSVENLCKDEYLRKNMDEHGWVSIFLIADFRRVQLLTDNMQFILDVLRCSDVVEVQGSKIRRRHGWRDWILTMDQNQCNVEPESPSTTTSQQSLVSPLESITLTETVGSNGDTST
ncbi:hypothetical protein KSP39_PZI004387 [Platanthera zijinensis]|uniref:HTH La-type RNA-binding domain-containing protein n=1 Tax=Platanthera zijinensis TaxID=2320716 RepID=A0AAP0GCR7_9ASPA